MDKDFSKGEIVIYTDVSGQYKVDVVLQDDTMWLTQKQLEELFQTDRTSIARHIKNILKEEELDEGATCAIFAQVRNEGGRSITRNITYYNLDMILAVGYRVTSKVATHFRKWSNTVLKEYLTKGYAINEKRLKQQQDSIEALKTSVDLLTRSLTNQIESIDDAQAVAKILNNFAHGLDLLDSFDHKRLDKNGATKKEAVRITTDEFLQVVKEMKSEFASDVFGNPKDESFDSSVNQIYQTFGGEELYPTLEEKASMLLYLITKNHSFSDGNKRIAASCFLYFLEKNGMLYRADKPIIHDSTLFALTVLIAESNPQEMETMKQIVVSVLNGGAD